MRQRADAGWLLGRALLASAAAADCAIAIEASASRDWASACFTGARHHLTLSGPDSPALRAWALGLAEAELPLRGHLVADLQVASVRGADGGTLHIRLEALTVEEH